MSKTGKILITLIIIILIIGFVWWVVGMSSPSISPSQPVPMNHARRMVVPAQTQAAAPAPAVTVTASSSVDSDLNSIDSQMNGLNQDDTNVDASVEPASNQ